MTKQGYHSSTLTPEQRLCFTCPLPECHPYSLACPYEAAMSRRSNARALDRAAEHLRDPGMTVVSRDTAMNA